MLSMIESQIFTSLFFLSLRYVANTIFGYFATTQSLINQPSDSVPVPDKTVLPSFVRSISGECIFILFLSMNSLANILTYSSRKTEESNMLKNETVTEPFPSGLYIRRVSSSSYAVQFLGSS